MPQQFVSSSDVNQPSCMLASIDPASLAVGPIASAWVDISNFRAVMALIQAGAFGAGATVDAKLQQAQDASGTGAIDIPGKAITQLVAAGGNNRQSMIVVPREQISINAGYCFVSLVVTIGVTATQGAASLWGLQPGWGGLAIQPLAASMAEIIGSGLVEE